MTAPRFLVIEDNIELAELISDILRYNGFFSVFVSNSECAIIWLEDHIPDVILLGMDLPDALGRKVLDYVHRQSRFARTPIIIATVDREIERVMIKRRLPVLVKPFTLDEFNTVVNAVMGVSA